MLLKTFGATYHLARPWTGDKIEKIFGCICNPQWIGLAIYAMKKNKDLCRMDCIDAQAYYWFMLVNLVLAQTVYVLAPPVWVTNWPQWYVWSILSPFLVLPFWSWYWLIPVVWLPRLHASLEIRCTASWTLMFLCSMALVRDWIVGFSHAFFSVVV